METKKAIFVCLLVLTVCMSCRLVDTLTGSGSAGTVNNLWSDVPVFEGATKSNLSLPLGARLIIRAAMQGKVNFIAYTTNNSAQEVQNFYSNEMMKQAGWSPSEKGCISDTEDKDSQGAICFFKRKDGNKEEGLAIIMAQDKTSKQTDIFYARIDLTELATTPSP